ncbi:MAG TPA: hypothetical protein VHE55_05965 [Fimbriimonadaceae bacterium]|nr:hypothetical protein [Fimbriimonadaceae bacterium]
MLTIGDVFSVVAFLFGMAFSAWALLIGSAMIFSQKARISESLLRRAPGRSFILGLFALLLVGFVSIVFLSVPLPAAKVLGYSGILIALSLATIGGGGLVLFVADRLRGYDAKLRPFAALTRGALYIVMAGLVPLLGLFVVFPAVLAMGMGTGIQALFMRDTAASEAGEYSM